MKPQKKNTCLNHIKSLFTGSTRMGMDQNWNSHPWSRQLFWETAWVPLGFDSWPQMATFSRCQVKECRSISDENECLKSHSSDGEAASGVIKHGNLVGGLEHVLFFHILGIILPTD